MGTFTVIAPHGGRLVNRVPPEAERGARREKLAGKKALTLGPREVSDLLMLGVGAFSPLEGFLTSADYHAVVREGRLASGLPWTIPIVLPVSEEAAKQVAVGDEVALRSASGELLGESRSNGRGEWRGATTGRCCRSRISERSFPS